MNTDTSVLRRTGLALSQQQQALPGKRRRLFCGVIALPRLVFGAFAFGGLAASALVLSALVLSTLVLSALVFSAGVLASTAAELPAQPVEVRHPDMARIVAADARLEVLSDGHQWAEGPVAEPVTGAVLFSDVPKNQIWRWSAETGAVLWLQPAGATGYQPSELKEGSNGLLFNQQGQLVLAQHGDRRLALLTQLPAPGSTAGQFSTLAGQYQGKLLNSPNDVVQARDGRYFFTDPPYGLKNGDKATDKQQPVNGVYQLGTTGEVRLLTGQLSRPNGIALSPDEQYLYVANSDPAAAQWWRLRRDAQGNYGQAELWLDVTAEVAKAPGLPDGLKVLPDGTLLATGPGGVWVISANKQVLGVIRTGVAAANVALNAEQNLLYITASAYLLRIELAAQTQ